MSPSFPCRRGSRLALAGACLVAGFGAGSRPGAAQVVSPVSPDDSLTAFQLDTGLKIELVACEPAVIDPIAMRFDEDGRLWVVEMRDYPLGPRPGEPPGSRICELSDRDGDGRYESSRVFAEHLLFPTGIQPWRGGLIVTLTGEVAYLKDTDGDGRADLRETWFRGFTAENPQLRANHPRFGWDGRVYVANGLRGGKISDVRAAGKQPKPLDIGGRDFCFDPNSSLCDAVSGNGQFGLTFDDFGNRFVCNNRAPLEHAVLENRYLARNPFLAVPSVIQDVASAGEQSRVFPLVDAWTTSNLHAGQFTAACGVEIYRGDALGPDYRGNAFVCEPTGSLVHREVISPDGSSFSSKPRPADREFLASRDSWFRPVNLETGPDGALYVVDMYRAVIEHPQFMPTELQQRPDLRLGDDRGRIYRITAAGGPRALPNPKLSAASTREVAALIAHKNPWWRETAARLLYERQDRSATKPLADIATGAAEPAARAQALWALEGLGACDPSLIEGALADNHPGVRQQAVLLAERRLTDRAVGNNQANENAATKELQGRLLAAADDADAGVRFCVALVAGGLKSPDATAALLKIARRKPDAWTRHAIAAALPEQSMPLLLGAVTTAIGNSDLPESSQISLVEELAGIVGSKRDLAEIRDVLAAPLTGIRPVPQPLREALLLGLAAGYERRGGAFIEVVTSLPQRTRDAVEGEFRQAGVQASAQDLADEARGRKIELLRYARSPEARDTLLQIATHDHSQAARIGAIAALANFPGGELGEQLLKTFPAQTPALRRGIVDAMLTDPSRLQRLLEAIEAGQVALGEIDVARRNRILASAPAQARELARKLFASAAPIDRQKVLAEYETALAADADPAAGKELFRKHCAGCHQVGDVGVNVAPDISDSRTKTPRQLLVDILSPNQAIDNNYVSYSVVTRDGAIHTGILTAETATSVTLKQAEGKTVDLLRGDIESLSTTGLSLMPEGFEKTLSRQELAAVISFIKNWRYTPAGTPSDRVSRESAR